MKKYIISFFVLCSFAVHADDWQKAYPVFDCGNGYVHYYFDQAYAKCRLIDDGKTMEIDLHDQVVRSGYFWDRMSCARLGVFMTKESLLVDNKMLLRVLSLVSGIETVLEESLDAWWLFGNFVLLDSLLAQDNEAVAQAFSKAYPDVTKISFTTADRGHPYRIEEVAYDDEALETWSTQFSDINVELDY